MLLLGPNERCQLAQLREQARQHPVDMPTLVEAMRTAQGSRRHRQQMTAQTIAIPTRYYVTFSIETGHPGGACRHMSMSTLADERIPRIEGIWMVAEELGFSGGIDECSLWLEDLSGGGKAVNVVQPISLMAGGRA